MSELTARGLLSFLFNASKGLDVVQGALEVGVLAALDEGPASVDALAARLGLVPGRLYKLLDCLEAMLFVERAHDGETFGQTVYRAREPLAQAAIAVLGPESQERERDRHPWRTLLGKMPAVLRGKGGIPGDLFPWPPETAEQLASFEASMAAGTAPIVESLLALPPLFRKGDGSPFRLLDVGGGDGTLAARLVSEIPNLHVDVFNLPETRGLVEETQRRARHGDRLGFVGGDFLAEPLPGGYDGLLFARVLHDWPTEVAAGLLRKGRQALGPGGVLVVTEEFRNAERLAVQFFWSYFLIGLDGCVSRLREHAFYTQQLEALGLRDIDVRSGPFDVVFGRCP